MNELLITFIIVIILVMLLTGGILLTFIISSRQKFKQQMELAETRLAFEQELRKVESEVTESMMKQFAGELHDNIGQLVTALHIHIENLKLDQHQLTETLKPAEIYISEINQQLRILSRTLNNDFIGHIGLIGAIRLETERLKALKRFHVSINLPEGPSQLQKNQELMVFRIFQEIVQNALRHAAAKNFSVEIDTSNEDFLMRIHDDGKGFDLEATLRAGKASGLRNMQKRAGLAGLELTIRSGPGTGSLFEIRKQTQLKAE